MSGDRSVPKGELGEPPTKAVAPLEAHRSPDESTAGLEATGQRLPRDNALEAPPLVPGERLAGRFTVLRLLARGGMGAVYECHDGTLRTRVALKLIRTDIASDAAALERFRREVLLARQVSHPNVCRVYELYQATTVAALPIHFLTMELLAGETLSQRLTRVGPLSTAEALPLLRQMCAGLAAAHAEGVIHRDFKPNNVMLVSRPERLEGRTQSTRVVITDFGVACALRPRDTDERLADEAVILGTPDYMAPEQVMGGDGTPVSDIYSLGVVLYEMVTGELPFTSATSLDAAARRLSEEPPKPESRIPSLDPGWSNAILRCLAREPNRRFQSALDVSEALERRPKSSLWRPPPKPDLIGVIEACYRVDQPELLWLRGCLDAAAPLLDAGIGLLAYTYESTQFGEFKRRLVDVRDSPQLEHLVQMLEALPPEIITTGLRARSAYFTSEIQDFRPLQEKARALGFELPDGFVVNGIDSDGVGCVLSAAVASPRLPSTRRALWARIAAHLGAAFRLQRRLAQARAAQTEAVLRTSGALVHAERPAQSREAREALSDASRSMMTARSRSGRLRPDETLPRWRPLVVSRWTLVEEFESDGQHFILAKKNSPPVGTISELGEQERQVLAFVALGHTNTQVAFELGISTSTVGTLLRRATRKLGASTRAEVIDLYRSQSGEDPAPSRQSSSTLARRRRE
jgi:serine/threonine protein kinase/DNA-binding CsgD family transcriptional regulator